MAEPKTKQNDQSVEVFLNRVEDPRRRQDCETLVRLMRDATGQEPRMWGEAMVGFGSRHYRYASGHEGDTFIIGFSPRKQNLTLYVLPYDHETAGDTGELLARLGKHTTGKSCLYIKKLDDVDQSVLTEIIQRSAEHFQSLGDSEGG